MRIIRTAVTQRLLRSRLTTGRQVGVEIKAPHYPQRKSCSRPARKPSGSHNAGRPALAPLFFLQSYSTSRTLTPRWLYASTRSCTFDLDNLGARSSCPLALCSERQLVMPRVSRLSGDSYPVNYLRSRPRAVRQSRTATRQRRLKTEPFDA